eukprot:TRINITY_DN1885_c0_g7_i2.p2 TRINITY_DN1885_c0_g7~~TRINITY_DN1885_c0_g7_i2.p2  ORF type:complete len:220 (-),score=7.90 TRINITY_DN1885_c0_g7_i2:35-694(-)
MQKYFTVKSWCCGMSELLRETTDKSMYFTVLFFGTLEKLIGFEIFSNLQYFQEREFYQDKFIIQSSTKDLQFILILEFQTFFLGVRCVRSQIYAEGQIQIFQNFTQGCFMQIFGSICVGFPRIKCVYFVHVLQERQIKSALNKICKNNMIYLMTLQKQNKVGIKYYVKIKLGKFCVRLWQESVVLLFFCLYGCLWGRGVSENVGGFAVDIGFDVVLCNL